MKTFNKIILALFLTILPVMVVVAIISHKIESSSFLGWGLIACIWTFCALYIGVALIASRSFREQLLKKITGIKERDEREELIVGRAARNTFLFNLGLLIFLFLLYFIRISSDGSQTSLSLQFVLIETSYTNNNGEVFYKFQFTSSGIILLLIISQISSFYIYSRRIIRSKN